VRSNSNEKLLGSKLGKTPRSFFNPEWYVGFSGRLSKQSKYDDGQIEKETARLRRKNLGGDVLFPLK